MALRTAEHLTISARGRLAPIFLSHEDGPQNPDLFDYSQIFYSEHIADELLEKKALPYGFGLISIVEQPSVEVDGIIPPIECIAFDARQPEEYVWDISYADAGVQQVVRLWIQQEQTQGVFARTDHQGGLIEIFTPDPWDVYAVQKHLAERLQSLEVKRAIEKTYEKRKKINRSKTKLVNERTAEKSEFAQSVNKKLEEVDTARVFDDQLAAQEQQLLATGFPPMMLFNPNWFDHIDT